MNLTEAEILEIQELGGVVLEEAKTTKEKFFKFIKKSIKLMNHGEDEDIIKAVKKTKEALQKDGMVAFIDSDEFRNKTDWTSEEKENFATFTKLKTKTRNELAGRADRERKEAIKQEAIDKKTKEDEDVAADGKLSAYTNKAIAKLKSTIKSSMRGIFTGEMSVDSLVADDIDKFINIIKKKAVGRSN